MTIFSYTRTPPRPTVRASGLLWARDREEALRRLQDPEARLVQLYPDEATAAVLLPDPRS